ncbi:MAG TPA: ATP-grasp domain-containing protein, partial [Gemmatirosa sp.]
APETTTAVDAMHRAGRWLVKPRASGGGRGVRPWRRGTRVPHGCDLQARIDGVPGSAVFVADGRRAVLLGVSRQLVGEAAFGARGFRYCGSILAGAGDGQFTGDEALIDAAACLADVATEALGLIGVNGIDFVAVDGVPHAIEVNPRYTASMELVERAYGISVFGAHARACTARELPAFDVRAARRGAGATGKAVLFASHPSRVGDTRAWLGDASVRDVPHPGEVIPAGGPVCTVFAEAGDAAACHAALERRAVMVYAALGIAVDGASGRAAGIAA